MALDGEHVYAHGSEVLVVKACLADDGPDLIALGGAHSVVVLSYTPSSCDVVASFYIGTPPTALAWSPRTSSPLAGSEFHIELVAAAPDGELRHLYKSQDVAETITHIRPDGALPHTGQIQDLSFCGNLSGSFGWEHVASTADDKNLVIWDIFPMESNGTASPREPSVDSVSSALFPPGIAETWSVPFVNPLHSIATHPENAKHLLVADSCGSVYLVDWQACCSSATKREEQFLMEFIEPRSLSQLLFSPAPSLTGSVSWKHDDVNVLAATFGDRWALWEQLGGSKPVATGTAFSTGARRLRWCPTDPNIFALCPLSQAHGAILHIHNVGFLNSPPTRFEIVANPHYIQDFDWVGVTYKESPLVAVAIGKLVHIMRIGESPDEEN